MHIFKTLGVLSKYIAIGTQLLEIYIVSIIVLFGSTNFSSFLKLNGLELVQQLVVE
jgi:hypothetical protein